MYVIVARALNANTHLDRFLLSPGKAGEEPRWDVHCEHAKTYTDAAEAERICGWLPRNTSANHYDYEVEEI